MASTLRSPRPDEEIAVVFTSQIKVRDVDGETYTEVVETMHTPFYGPRALARAEAFKRSEQDRDFTDADDWHWRVWRNQAASDAWVEEVFGSDSEEVAVDG